MRLHYLWLVLLVGVCILFGCNDNSDDSNSESIPVTQVTFTQRLDIGPDIFTTVTITPNSIEYVRTESGNITRQWSKQIEVSDFNSIQKIINDYNIFQSDNITLDTIATSDIIAECIGVGDTTITINRIDDSSHTFDISGVVYPEYWPEGVRALVELKGELVAKYQ